ncbi:unnamed protein product [Anisakis simplex]|uniref:GRANULINS domain-containing protein n=1 Tax=Anisakis simplex TaxID=6269 RepID=A0A0M3JBF9_ANISI|nr:unnamed protein product [Anisakis simplex]
MNGAAPRGTCDSDAACPPQYRCNAQSLCCPHTNVYCSAKYQCDIRKCPPNQFCSPLTQCCRPLISTKQRYTTCDSSLPCASDLICSEGRCIAKEDQSESTSTSKLFHLNAIVSFRQFR